MAERSVEDALARSTLQQLRMLSENAQMLDRIQDEKSREQEEISRLSSVAAKLRERVRTLQHRSQVLRQQPRLASAVPRTFSPSKRQHTAAALSSAHELAQKRQKSSLALALRLTGRTVVAVDARTVSIRFETFAAAAYRDTFHVLLRVRGGDDEDSNDASLIVWCHTIPAFVPMRPLQSRFLPHDVQGFCDAVDDHLQAFASRRQLIAEMVERFPAIPIESNTACTLVTLKPTARDGTTLDINLSADDLLESRLPVVSVLTVTKDANEVAHRVFEVEENFLRAASPTEALKALLEQN